MVCFGVVWCGVVWCGLIGRYCDRAGERGHWQGQVRSASASTSQSHSLIFISQSGRFLQRNGNKYLAINTHNEINIYGKNSGSERKKERVSLFCQVFIKVNYNCRTQIGSGRLIYNDERLSEWSAGQAWPGLVNWAVDVHENERGGNTKAVVNYFVWGEVTRWSTQTDFQGYETWSSAQTTTSHQHQGCWIIKLCS